MCLCGRILSTFVFNVYLSEEIEIKAAANCVNAPACTVEKVAAPPGTFHTFNIVKHTVYPNKYSQFFGLINSKI